jgi:hypothetical protein
MYIAKLKDGPKRVKKTFSMILERVFEMVWWSGENGITSKRIFEVQLFFSSQNIEFPFYLKRLLELSFFPYPFFVLGGLMIFEEKITSSKTFLNGFNILAVDAYSKMKLCTPIWLNQDYGDGGVVNILAVGSYSWVEVCTPIFLGEGSNFFSSKSFLKKIQNLNGHIP